jgi:hypothetical protein
MREFFEEENLGRPTVRTDDLATRMVSTALYHRESEYYAYRVDPARELSAFEPLLRYKNDLGEHCVDISQLPRFIALEQEVIRQERHREHARTRIAQRCIDR